MRFELCTPAINLSFKAEVQNTIIKNHKQDWIWRKEKIELKAGN